MENQLDKRNQLKKKIIEGEKCWTRAESAYFVGRVIVKDAYFSSFDIKTNTIFLNYLIYTIWETETKKLLSFGF
jgi:hypothetical protein